MAYKSDIQWTDATWTPIRARVKTNAAAIAIEKGYKSLIQIADKMAGRVGPHCERHSPGCDNCYSETNNGRCLPVNGTGLPFDRRARDLVDIIVDEKILEQPLHWHHGKKIFVCSQTDLFAEFVPVEYIARVFAVMAVCQQHTNQVLTKRAGRAHDVLTSEEFWDEVRCFMAEIIEEEVDPLDRRSTDIRATAPEVNPDTPLNNVWLGVSVEDQKTADERIPWLLRTPAAKRFVSYEPALGPVKIPPKWLCPCSCYVDGHPHTDCEGQPRIDWLIAGGESGPGARPAHPQWFRDVRDQCVAANVPFLLKQWGAWSPIARTDGIHESPFGYNVENKLGFSLTGKKKAGRLLDGVEWNQFPEVRR